jgi:8-oxo-dGTP pyrophosphatase MutT (NUDIX family)
MTTEPSSSLTFTYHPSLTPFNITVKTYLSHHPSYDGIAGSALIFSPQGRLLILQRASHDSMPNRWETPGGAVDFSDPSILDGVAREVLEEAGLRTTKVLRLIGPGDGRTVFFTSRKGLKICKFTFEVEVESTEAVRLDPREHQDYLWVSEEECRGRRVEREGEVVEFEFTGPAQEATILEGFRLRREAK